MSDWVAIRSPAAVTYAYHTDALGSVVAITSPSGAVVATYAYGPYGGVTQVGGSDAALAAGNPLRYRAYYHDTGTGHYYLPARYYDPDTMRFLSPDPAPPSAGDPLTLNRYAYCVGDPVDMSDPTGEIADWDGDGRVSAYEASDHASRHTSNPRLRKYFRARSLALYHARAATTAAVRQPAPAAPLAEWAFHSNLSLLPTRPDALGWTLMGAGAVGDIAKGCGAITSATVPQVGLPAFRLAKGYNRVVDTLGLLHAGFQLYTKDGSLGDVAFAGVSYVDGLSTGVLMIHIGLMVADGAGMTVYCEPSADQAEEYR